MKPKLYLDTEFSQVSEPRVKPVCISLYDDVRGSRTYWTHGGDYTESLVDILQHAKSHDFVSYSVEAEARFLRAIGLDDKTLLSITWIDLYLEWRMLLNHNDNLICGKHLDGTIRKAVVKGQEVYTGKPSYSYAGATYRLLGIRIDTEQKQKMRDLIISNPPKYYEHEQKAVMEYCESDVKYLPQLLSAMMKEYSKLLPKSELATIRQEILLRAEYAVRTAIMVDTGYPINVEQTRNFADNTSLILYDCISDINSQFPDIQPFKWHASKAAYSMNTKAVKAWIAEQKLSDWDLTPTKDLSLSLDAWEKYYDYKHDYPRNNFGAQMVRYLKLKQSLNGFMPRKDNAKTKSFFEYVGSDGRVRPYFGIYGSQSGRSQQAASGFIPLKAAWMRSLIQPRPGRAIASIDYGSQEFLIAALVSNDERMLKAYESGDVYLGFARDIGLVPKNATKATHKFERDLCKSAILGMSYLMSKYGLSHKLTQDTGKYHSEDDAQHYIDLFDETYNRNTQKREDTISGYHDRGYIKLPCGWTMFGSNPNFRSVANMPIQGLGASILRKAVAFAQDSGLNVIYTLHDALYIEYDSGDYAAIDKLAKAMDDGFRYYIPDKLKSRATCKLDADTWSLDYDVADIVTPDGMKVSQSKIYIDERAVSEYKFFEKYFYRARNSDLDLL